MEKVIYSFFFCVFCKITNRKWVVLVSLDFGSVTSQPKNNYFSNNGKAKQKSKQQKCEAKQIKSIGNRHTALRLSENEFSTDTQSIRRKKH